MAKTRQYGSTENDKVKSKTGNEANEQMLKHKALIKKRLAEGKKVIRSRP